VSEIQQKYVCDNHNALHVGLCRRTSMSPVTVISSTVDMIDQEPFNKYMGCCGSFTASFMGHNVRHMQQVTFVSQPGKIWFCQLLSAANEQSYATELVYSRNPALTLLVLATGIHWSPGVYLHIVSRTHDGEQCGLIQQHSWAHTMQCIVTYTGLSSCSSSAAWACGA